MESPQYALDAASSGEFGGLRIAPAPPGGAVAKAPPRRGSAWWRSLTGSRFGGAVWFLLGACVTAAAFVVAERGVAVPFLGGPPTVAMDPLIVPSGPAGKPRRLAIGGPEQLTVGTPVTVEGALPSLQHGRMVAVRVRWNGGAWEGRDAALAAEDGSFRVRYVLDRPGTAQVRIVLPGGGFAFKWYRVG